VPFVGARNPHVKTRPAAVSNFTIGLKSNVVCGLTQQVASKFPARIAFKAVLLVWFVAETALGITEMVPMDSGSLHAQLKRIIFCALMATRATSVAAPPMVSLLLTYTDVFAGGSWPQ